MALGLPNLFCFKTLKENDWGDMVCGMHTAAFRGAPASALCLVRRARKGGHAGGLASNNKCCVWHTIVLVYMYSA
jgi:hypothetical protein